MQVTSASSTSQPARGRSLARVLARLNHPAWAALAAFAGWLGYALARYVIWAKGHLVLFVMAGCCYGHYGYTHPGQLPHGFMIADPHSAGYDGQFYYRLALNPFNWAHTAYGITMDHSYRFTRIGYPLVAWVISLGRHELVPAALVAINLACVAVMAFLGAQFARQGGRHALWGVAFAAYFGLAISVGRDTAEPLAEVCLLGGLLALRRDRWVLAGLAFGFGVITRENILLAPAAFGLIRVIAILRRRVRPGRADLAWLLPAAAFVALEGAAKLVLSGGGSSVGGDASRNLYWPFAAMSQSVWYDVTHIDLAHLGFADIALLEFVTLAAFVVAGFAVLRPSRASGTEKLTFVFFVAELALMSSQIWQGAGGQDFADGRNMIEPFLLALVLLFSAPARIITRRRLMAITAIAVPALIVVARRRILFM